MNIEVIVLSIMGVFLAVTLGLLVATGIVIFKDAKAHGMNGGLWAVVAIFAPNFIGVIIYLIVRHGIEKQYRCSNCNEEVQSDYNICPSCQGVFEKICSVCKNAVKSNMAYCPYCGNQVDELESMKTATKVVKKTNIIKPLAIIGGIYVAAFLIVMATMFTVALTAEEGFTTESSVMEMEINTFSKMESTFKYKNGKEDMSFKLEEGEIQPIHVEVGLTSGSIILTTINPSGEVIYEKLYEEGSYSEDFQIEATEKGRYAIWLKVEDASGNYKINKVK